MNAKSSVAYAFVLTALLCDSPMARTNAGEHALPGVRVSNVRRAFHNGEHNAFTDLCRFRDRYYLTFRSCPDGHGVYPTASIIVLASDDAQSWQQVHRFRVEKRDTRDPHFLIFGDKLLVYTGTWYCGESSPTTYDMNRHLGYAVSTDNGNDWSEPVMLEGTYGHYIWRAATFGGKAYLCGRRKRGFVETRTREQRDPVVESALLESDDGLVWRRAALFQETYGDETAFLFEPDGSILAVARSGGGRNAQLCRASPPYDTWQREDLDRYIGGPLLVKWDERYVVGGRKSITGEAKTSLYWLANEALHEFAELPSGGDCSYPGFVELRQRVRRADPAKDSVELGETVRGADRTGADPNRALVSWYSSHEKDEQGRTITAIYLAELEIGEGGP